jgi:hypothetical protein
VAGSCKYGDEPSCSMYLVVSHEGLCSMELVLVTACYVSNVDCQCHVCNGTAPRTGVFYHGTTLLDHNRCGRSQLAGSPGSLWRHCTTVRNSRTWLRSDQSTHTTIPHPEQAYLAREVAAGNGQESQDAPISCGIRHKIISLLVTSWGCGKLLSSGPTQLYIPLPLTSTLSGTWQGKRKFAFRYLRLVH